MAAFILYHRALHQERLAGYEQARAAIDDAPVESDPFVLATLDFGLAYERAVLAWFDQLPPALRDDAAQPTAPDAPSAAPR